MSSGEWQLQGCQESGERQQQSLRSTLELTGVTEFLTTTLIDAQTHRHGQSRREDDRRPGGDRTPIDGRRVAARVCF